MIADAGGIVEVWTHLADSLEHFVGSIKAMVDAIGVNHVGMGTDTDLLSARPANVTTLALPGLARPRFESIAVEMLKQGFAVDEVRKIGGGNLCRVFDLATRH